MKSFKFSLVFFTSFLIFGQNSYADNIPVSFIQAVRMSKLKSIKTINSNKNLSFAQTVKLQKQKKNNIYSFEFAKFDTNSNYSYIQATDNNNLKYFILKRNPSINNLVAEQIVVEVIKHCEQKNIDPKLIIALMTIESNFNKNAISPVGAMGLGQLMPGTASDLGVSDAYNINQNIRGTINYLSYLLKSFNGNLELSLASYNMGPNAVKKAIEQNNEIPSSVKEYVYNIKYIKSTI